MYIFIFAPPWKIFCRRLWLNGLTVDANCSQNSQSFLSAFVHKKKNYIQKTVVPKTLFDSSSAMEDSCCFYFVARFTRDAIFVFVLLFFFVFFSSLSCVVCDSHLLSCGVLVDVSEAGFAFLAQCCFGLVHTETY